MVSTNDMRMSESRATGVAGKLMEMLREKKHNDLKQYLEQNISDIDLFPPKKLASIIQWCVVFTPNSDQLFFVSRNLRPDILNNILNYDDCAILKSFVQVQSRISNSNIKPDYDYRAMRIAKFELLLEMNADAVSNIMMNFAPKYRNATQISEDVRVDFSVALGKYTRLKLAGNQMSDNQPESKLGHNKRSADTEIIRAVPQKKFKP